MADKVKINPFTGELNIEKGAATVREFHGGGSRKKDFLRHQIIGNTSGVTQQISEGTYYLAGGNNVTLSQQNNSVTISGGGAGINTLGMSNVGNTSGTTGVVTGTGIQMVFAGGNNITLSQSLNGASGTVTISAFTQSAESNTAGMSNLGNTAGTTGVVSGNQIRVLFAGGNNITLSQSLDAGNRSATITISAGAAGGLSAGVSTGGNTAGTTGTVSDRLVFVGGNNITLSQSTGAGGSATITISALNTVGFTGGISSMGNTSGSTGMVTRRIVFVGSPNITLSGSTEADSAATITISANPQGVANLSFWQNMVPASTDNAVNRTYNARTLYVFPIDLGNAVFPGNMTVNTWMLNMTYSWTQTNSFASTLRFVIYTINSSTLSSASSFSTTFGSTSNNASLSSLYHGKRWLTAGSIEFGGAINMSQGFYYGGILLNTAGVSVAFQPYGAVFQESGIRSGTMNVGTTTGATSWGGIPFHGIYSATTLGIPTAIQHSELQKTELRAYFVPNLAFNNLLATM